MESRFRKWISRINSKNETWQNINEIIRFENIEESKEDTNLENNIDSTPSNEEKSICEPTNIVETEVENIEESKKESNIEEINGHKPTDGHEERDEPTHLVET